MRTGLCTSGQHRVCGGTVNRGTTDLPRLADCSCSCHRQRTRSRVGGVTDDQARIEALERDGYRCAARTPVCHSGQVEFAGDPLHVHHRRRRGQGGTDELDNLLTVCSACHRWIHDHPAESYDRGWLIPHTSPQGARVDPEEV